MESCPIPGIPLINRQLNKEEYPIHLSHQNYQLHYWPLLCALPHVELLRIRDWHNETPDRLPWSFPSSALKESITDIQLERNEIYWYPQAES